jgi:two-component system chemotaxis response regulator CheY
MQYLALVVEDDRALRLIYRRVLSDLDFDVLEASDSPAALNLLENYAPQVVFLDILLPKVNGQIVLDYLNRTPRLDRTYVAVVSSNRRFEELVIGRSSREFVLKPIRPAQIREIAARAINVVV